MIRIIPSKFPVAVSDTVALVCRSGIANQRQGAPLRGLSTSGVTQVAAKGPATADSKPSSDLSQKGKVDGAGRPESTGGSDAPQRVAGSKPLWDHSSKADVEERKAPSIHDMVDKVKEKLHIGQKKKMPSKSYEIPHENVLNEFISPISSMFYCEFHNIRGPEIIYEVPDTRFKDTGLLEQIASFIIPKPELMARQMTITRGNYRIVGYPVHIEGKYHRNFLKFNLCFVFNIQAEVRPYEPVIKKLGDYLRTVEGETGFLSNASSKATLPQLMTKMLTDLNGLGRCSVEINTSNTLFLKVVPPDRGAGPVVHDFDVPVLLSDAVSHGGLVGDLTTRQVVPLIDGVKNVHQISEEVDADPDLVKSCVQNMMFYEIVKVVPAFHHTNVHRATPGLKKFISDPVLQQECIKTVARHASDPPSLRDIMILFGDMQIGVTVKSLLSRHSSIAARVDERKLCDFGVIHGFIRRVYKYPLYTRYNQTTAKSATPMKMFSGVYHTDEIRQKLELSVKDLDERIEADQLICVCWK